MSLRMSTPEVIFGVLSDDFAGARTIYDLVKHEPLSPIKSIRRVISAQEQKTSNLFILDAIT